VPFATFCVIVMPVQFTAMADSAWSARMMARLGEGRALYTTPIVICASLLLAALQMMPAMPLIAVMGFVTAVVRSILISCMQQELSDDSATMLLVESLTFTVVAALRQPSLGTVADRWGLPAVYITLAGALSVVMVVVFWKGQRHVCQAGRKELIWSLAE
jgi:hypothetical protein